MKQIILRFCDVNGMSARQTIPESFHPNWAEGSRFLAYRRELWRSLRKTGMYIASYSEEGVTEIWYVYDLLTASGS